MKLTQCTLCGAEFILKTTPEKDHLCKHQPYQPHPQDIIKDLKQQLASVQAENKRYRKALERIATLGYCCVTGTSATRIAAEALKGE